MSRVGPAALVAAIGALVYLLAVWTHAGLALDAGVLGAVSHIPGLSDPVGDAMQTLIIPMLVIGSATVIVLAVRSHRVAAASLAMLAGLLSVTTAEVLKVALPGRPGDPVAPLSGPLDLLNPAWWAYVHSGPVILSGSFPSGHSAIATALALALLTAMRPRLARHLASPIMLLAAVASGATVLAGWHRPSDALGGMLLALAWWLVLVPAGVLREVSSDGGPGVRSRPAVAGSLAPRFAPVQAVPPRGRTPEGQHRRRGGPR